MGALRRVIDRSAGRRAEADKCENLERWTASCRCDPSGEWETIFYRLRFESDGCGRMMSAFIIVLIVCILCYRYVTNYIYYIVITDDINGSQRDGAVYTADVTSWLLPRGRRAPLRLSSCCGPRGRQLISLGARPEKSSQIRRWVVDDNCIGIIIIFWRWPRVHLIYSRWLLWCFWNYIILM